MLPVMWSHSCRAGTLPAAYGNCANLTYLYLHGNRFNGTLPPEWGSGALSSKLMELYITGNNLTGCVVLTDMDVVLLQLQD